LANPRQKFQTTGANTMSNTIGIIIIISFMAVCMHGAYLIIKDKEQEKDE